MLKFPNLSDDYMIEYYTCLKEILNLYQIVAHPSNNYECLISKKFPDQVDAIIQKIKKEYAPSIIQRIKLISTEVVYDIPCNLYHYLLDKLVPEMIKSKGTIYSTNFHFRKCEDYPCLNSIIVDCEYESSDLESILKRELKLRPIVSTVTRHKSMYNPEDTHDYYLPTKSKYLQKIFLFEHFFMWFNDYYNLYRITVNTLMNEDGFMSKPWRFYIAIMSVSTVKCEYMLRVLEELFLESGGDESWLVHGLDVVPEKLVKLSRISNILAHQPWILKANDIKELNTPNEKGYWNLNELMQAALITIEFNKLAIIVESLNIKLIDDEAILDNPVVNSTLIQSNDNQNKSDTKEEHPIDFNVRQKIIENLVSIIKSESAVDIDLKIKEEIKLLQKQDGDRHKNDPETSEPCIHNYKENEGVFSKHVHKHCRIYHDFDAHSEEFRSYLDFNWEDHALHILRNLFPIGIDVINNEIQYFTTLTTNSLGEEDRKLNTFPIRYAISCYIEKIFGYIHEDYNYSNVNKLLLVNYKKFIKNVACYPKNLTKEDFTTMNFTFNNEEIMHIIILVSIIKSRTQLTYFASSLYEVIKHIE